MAEGAAGRPYGVGEVGIDLGVVGLVEPDRRCNLLVDPAACGPRLPHRACPFMGPSYRRPVEGPDRDGFD
jgi:hypothetical protein